MARFRIIKPIAPGKTTRNPPFEQHEEQVGNV
jgi:hypothetical protein